MGTFPQASSHEHSKPPARRKSTGGLEFLGLAGPHEAYALMEPVDEDDEDAAEFCGDDADEEASRAPS